MSLKIIGAGFGRTGTTSLKAALEHLGFEPSYHMAEVVGVRPGVNDGHLGAWHGFPCRGVVPDWRRMVDGYLACTDSPCVFSKLVRARDHPASERDHITDRSIGNATWKNARGSVWIADWQSIRIAA